MRTIAAEDYLLVYEQIAKRAIDTFNEHKFHGHVVLAIELGDEPGSIEHGVVLDPELVDAAHENASAMEALTTIVQQLVSNEGPVFDCFHDQFDMEPHIAVHISEMWMVQQSIGTPPPSVPPALHPDRRECLLIRLISAETMRYGYCPIDSETRVAAYKPLVDVVANFGQFTSSSGPQAGLRLH